MDLRRNLIMFCGLSENEICRVLKVAVINTIKCADSITWEPKLNFH